MKRMLFSVVLLIALLGCITTDGDQPRGSGNHFVQITDSDITLKGVSLSPKSYVAADFIDFFFTARDAGNALMWAGDWIELNDSADTSTQLAVNHALESITEVQFFDQASGELIRPLDNSTKQMYAQLAVDFAEKFKPRYLGLGIEINVLYEESPEDFYDFVDFFSEVYDEIKAVSPNTSIFTVFQLERIKGLRGGLYGGANDVDENDWELLDLFPKADAIMFTTYPGLIYQDPWDIPVDYYDTDILVHTDKPVGFTEIGWHSADSPQGWESSESEQVRFVEAFFNLIELVEPEILIWSFLYDQSVMEPFDTMGLYHSNGTAKAAWNSWVSAD